MYGAVDLLLVVGSNLNAGLAKDVFQMSQIAGHKQLPPCVSVL